MRADEDADRYVAEGRRALRAMEIEAAIAAFERALQRDAGSVAAHLGLYEALQVRGDRLGALEHQRRALARQRLFIDKEAEPGAPTMLVVAIPGDWQANVPLEFLYPFLSTGIRKLYVGGDPFALPDPRRLSPYDVVFNAVAESDDSNPTLRVLEDWLPRLGRPVLNEPARVRKLSRDRVARDYADLPGAVVPATQRIRREDLPRELAGPHVIRPVGSQAGAGFAKVHDGRQLADYLAAHAAKEFYLTPFVDYRGADGFFRKYRIIFVGGVPFAHHLAISDRWMVHYYNALNAREPWIRDEEERFLADVHAVFGGPRASVLEQIVRRAGLDYFGLDCSILPDGRILVFEIDTAMIVHLGDPPGLYPYKHRYVPRIPQALERLISAKAKG
jgi:tetratricopeptide (TPR) repeat protein